MILIYNETKAIALWFSSQSMTTFLNFFFSDKISHIISERDPHPINQASRTTCNSQTYITKSPGINSSFSTNSPTTNNLPTKMQLLTVVLGLGLMVGLSQAACCTPKKWQGYVSETGGKDGWMGPHLIMVRFYFTYFVSAP